MTTSTIGHTPTILRPCGKMCARSSRRVLDPPNHVCNRRERHNEPMCRCACGRDFREEPELVTVADWITEGLFWLRVADDRVREADRARWSTNPAHARTEKERAALIHNSLGANASAASCIMIAQRMLTEESS